MSMKKLYLLLLLLFVFSPVMGYEFEVSALSKPVSRSIPKQVLVRKKPAAVIFVKTQIADLRDQGDGTIEQEKTSDGYVLYCAPDWPIELWFVAPGFSSKQVEIGKLPPNTAYELTVRQSGNAGGSVDLAHAKLSLAPDMTNATAAVTEPYCAEIWINIDSPFRDGGYEVINGSVAPYRVRPKRKNPKAKDILSPMALNKLGKIDNMPLEDRVVYNLNIR